MTQTTHLTSFGPVFVVGTFHLSRHRIFCSFKIYIFNKTLVNIKEYEIINAPMAYTTHLGPFSSLPPSISLPIALFVVQPFVQC